MLNGDPFADQVRFVLSLGWKRSVPPILIAFAFVTSSMILSSLVVVSLAFPEARDNVRQSFGFGKTIQLGDIVINGEVPGEDDPYDDEADPCEKPLTFGCEFAQEPDITYLLMPPFVGPWEESPMRLHWTIFVLTSRWQLVCPTNDP